MNRPAACFLLALSITLPGAVYAQKQLFPPARALRQTTAISKGPEISSVSTRMGLAPKVFFKPLIPYSNAEKLLAKNLRLNARAQVQKPISVPLPPRLSAQKRKQRQMAVFDAHAAEMMVNLQNPFLWDLMPVAASAFFVEETYQGQRYLWAVTAQHVADLIGPDIYAHRTFEEGSTLRFPLKTAVKGNAGMADIALLEVPPELAELVRPISLAQQDAQPGDVLRSYGFFADDLRIVHNRRVLAVAPNRAITSFEFADYDRSGACGGPVLNENNEVVGVHVGSSSNKKESYVVPVSWLKNLLYAAHHNGIYEQDLVLNGRTIGTINIDEYIYSLNVKRNGATVRSLVPWRMEFQVDYSQLEKLLSPAQGDEMEIIIIKNGTVQTASDDQATRRMLTVDLKTGEVEQTDLSSNP